MSTHRRRACLLAGFLVSSFLTPAGLHAQTVDATFNPGANDDVNAVAIQADGKILIGGAFRYVGGGGSGTVPRDRIARLNADGSVDTSFNPGANGIVRAIAVQPDGKILVGGDFTGMGGSDSTGWTARNYIGRINADGSLDTTFNAPHVSGSVFAISLQPNGSILIGGNFFYSIDRLFGSGAWDSGFDPGCNDKVLTILQTGGKIWVGGDFIFLGGGGSGYGGSGESHVGRLNADGSLDTGFVTDGANDRVSSLVVQGDGKILVGGSFTTLGFGGGKIGSATRNGIGRLNADGSLDTAFNPGISPAGSGSVDTMAVQNDGKILLGGYFWALGGGNGATTRNYIGRLNADGSVDSTFNPGANGPVSAIAVQRDGSVLVGGSFTALGGGGTGSMARYNIGRIQVGGSPQTCTSFTIQPSSVNPGSSAGSQLVTVTGSPANCVGGGWSASGNGSWLTVSPTSGSGSGSTTVSWTQNVSTNSRTDAATIAQNSFTATQSGAAAQSCTSYTIQPSSVNPTSSAGSQVVTITGAPANCVGGSWSASGNGSWLTVSPASGSGSGSTTVSWAQNTSANSRADTATIAQNSFTATQSGAAAQSCTSYTIQPSSVNPNSSAGAQAVTIIGSPPNCVGGTWSASGNGSWLTVFPTSDIVGSTTVFWTQNTSASSRTGTAAIAQNAFTVTQAAAPVTPPQTVTIGVELGSGNANWGGGTIVSLDNPATADGNITTVTFRWTFGSRSCADVAKIKFFRRSGNILTLTAERGPFPASSNLGSNYNTITLSTPVSVQAGDLIGIVTMAADGSCGSPQGLVGTTTNGLIVFSGDVKGSVKISDGFTWPNPLALFGTGFVPAPPKRRAAPH